MKGNDQWLKTWPSPGHPIVHMQELQIFKCLAGGSPSHLPGGCKKCCHCPLLVELVNVLLCLSARLPDGGILFWKQLQSLAISDNPPIALNSFHVITLRIHVVVAFGRATSQH